MDGFIFWRRYSLGDTGDKSERLRDWLLHTGRYVEGFESFTEELQLKGLKGLKPPVLAELVTGRNRVHVRIDDLQPAHLKSIKGGNLFLHDSHCFQSDPGFQWHTGISRPGAHHT